MALPVINNPCPENWENMTRGENGRFCGKCAKIVIDFTKKTTQEIVDFLMEKGGQDVCGKLRLQSVAPSAPLGLTSTAKSGLRIFAAALYLVFGSMLFTACGSDQGEVGKVALDSATEAMQQHERDSVMHADSISQAQHPPVDTDYQTPLDTAGMRDALRIMDSIGKLKMK